jgi:hypothetical protein
MTDNQEKKDLPNVLKSEGGGVVSAAMDAIDAGVGECVKG